MSLLTILETVFIGPIKIVFDLIFVIAIKITGHPGLAIIVLSLVMNILVLPLYRRADMMQEEARDMDAKLSKGISHIKSSFSGDERMMILQTYYRQNHYSPLSALNGSVSLLLEVPFFMAAYQFLSNLEVLNGVAFGPIKDLAAPDGLLVLGSVSINLLPILMTVVNAVSSAIYLKGFPLKTKIQLYGMALFFLFFLYTSPSCLVFYWTLNNIFSLVKTILYKVKNPRKKIVILTSILGLAFLIFTLSVYQTNSIRRKILLVGVGLILQLPAVAVMLGKRIHIQIKDKQENKKQFLLGCLFLAVLTGVLIPSNYIAASPQEFVDLAIFHHPLKYIVSSACMAAGTFIVWFGVFYWLSNHRIRVLFERLVWLLCGIMLINYLFFGRDLGIISSALKYEHGVSFSTEEQIWNVVILGVAVVSFVFIEYKWPRFVTTILLTATIALGSMSAVNIATISESIDKIAVDPTTVNSSTPTFELSKNGKNVVVFMLDRAVGEYIPFFFNERPALQEQFSGFTYYSNTVSFGGYTNFGTPPLLGGYEYTPVEMNKRKTESLVSKHNEALKVLPVLFAEEGYQVTVCDPVYANYQWIPDTTIYDEYPDIQSYNTIGKFSDTKQKELIVQNNHRNFFCFSIMKTMPLLLQPSIYDYGQYNQTSSFLTPTQKSETMYTASGNVADFTASYYALENLHKMTQLTDESKNTFLFMSNDTPHIPVLLQLPDYEPSEVVDNTQFAAQIAENMSYNGRTLVIEDTRQMTHYHSNMAAIIQMGKWFDYLREIGVYDNTRVILVADHGQDLHHLEELDHGGNALKDVELYYPLLMVKDFDSQEFKESSEFMTNADVPTIAVSGLIENPKNPFTGKIINNDEKYAHEQLIIMSQNWDVAENDGNTFLPAYWASVKDDIWNKDNWSFSDELVVLDEHELS